MIIDIIKNRIIRPSEYDSWLRTTQNIQYAIDDGYRKGMVPLQYEVDSYRAYEKWDWAVSSGKVYRKIPQQCVIVNKEEFDLSGIESTDIEKNRAIIYKRDYYRLTGFNLHEQYNMYCLDVYTDLMNGNFYLTLKRKLSKKESILGYLRNFYLRPEDLLLNYLTVKDQALLVKEKLKENKEKILCLRADYHFVGISIESLEGRIKKSCSLKRSLEEDLEKLALKFDRINAKREKLLRKSIFSSEYEDDLKKIDSEFDRISNEITDLPSQIDLLEREINGLRDRLDSYLKIRIEIQNEIEKLNQENYEKKFDLEFVLNNSDSIIELVEKENRE
jgi:archaellum component FlaC